MEKWVIYARCSTEEQAKEGYSIEMQINSCISIINNMPNSIHYKSYVDEGLSGSDTMSKRQALMEMLTDVRKKKFNGLVIFKADRLSRLAYEREQLIQMLLRYGIKIVSYSGEILTDNSPQGEFIRRVLANIDELEVKTLSFRVKTAMTIKAEKGEWKGGRPPYGFKWDEVQEKMIPINKDVADHIRLIYKMYTQEMKGSSTILNYLIENNIPYYCNNHQEQWSRERIYQVLKTPLYCGYQHHNTRYGKFDILTDNKKFKDKSEWQLYPAKFIEPIIDKEIWDKAQEIRRKRGKKLVPATKTTWLLSGILYCSKCGSQFYGHPQFLKGRNGQKYDCSSYICEGRINKSSKFCNAKQVSKKTIESYIMEYIWQKVNSYVDSLKSEQFINQQIDEILNSNKSEIKKIDKELESINKKMERYYNDYESGKIPADIMAPAIKRLKEQQQEILELRNKLAVQEEERYKIIQETKETVEALTDWLQYFKSVTEEDIGIKKASLMKIIDKIYLDTSTKEIKVIFHFNMGRNSICID